MVTDVTLAEGSATALVADARGIQPSLRVILVAPASRPPTPPTNPNHRPDVVLLRPFRIRQFAEALVPGGNPPGTPPT